VARGNRLSQRKGYKKATLTQLFAVRVAFL